MIMDAILRGNLFQSITDKTIKKRNCRFPFHIHTCVYVIGLIIYMLSFCWSFSIRLLVDRNSITIYINKHVRKLFQA